MNYSKFNLESPDAKERPFLNQDRTAWQWCHKFWQFSLFYGDYLAKLHSKRK
jgi:hypothetical protein